MDDSHTFFDFKKQKYMPNFALKYAIVNVSATKSFWNFNN